MQTTTNRPIWWLPMILRPARPFSPSLVCNSFADMDDASDWKTTSWTL